MVRVLWLEEKLWCKHKEAWISLCWSISPPINHMMWWPGNSPWKTLHMYPLIHEWRLLSLCQALWNKRIWKLNCWICTIEINIIINIFAGYNVFYPAEMSQWNLRIIILLLYDVSSQSKSRSHYSVWGHFLTAFPVFS